MKSRLQAAQNRLQGLHDLESAQNSLLLAQKAKSSINIENYPYKIVVKKPVQVKELVKVNRLQDFNEIRYGGPVYESAISNAKKNLDTALSRQEAYQKKLDEATDTETKIRQEINEAKTSYNQADSNFASHQSNLQDTRNSRDKAQEDKKSIRSQDYVYIVEVQRKVSTDEWFKKYKWKSFQEPRFNGAAHKNAIQDANTKIQTQQNNVSNLLSSGRDAILSLKQSNQNWYDAQSKLNTATKLVSDVKRYLDKAANDVKKAQDSQKLIDVKNYPYTVVVQKLVEVEEFVSVTKLQEFHETKYGGADYESAMAKINKDVAKAINDVVSCRKALDIAIQEEAQLLQDVEQNKEEVRLDKSDQQQIKFADKATDSVLLEKTFADCSRFDENEGFEILAIGIPEDLQQKICFMGDH
jgi:hypothetical protein